MSNLPRQCLNCGSSKLFTQRTGAGGGYGPDLLKGLGGFLRFAKFDVILCSDCGRCEFFADEQARQKAQEKWQRLGDVG